MKEKAGDDEGKGRWQETEEDGMEGDGMEGDGMESNGKRRNWRSMTFFSLRSDVAKHQRHHNDVDMQSSAGDSLLLKMAGLPKMGRKETTMSEAR